MSRLEQPTARSPWRTSSSRVSPWLLGLGLVGCSSADEGVPAPSALSDGGADNSSNGDPWGDSAADDGNDGSADGDGADDAGQILDVGGAPPPPTGEGEFSGCPQPLPPGWVLCEDFETIRDPAEVSLDYQEVDGAFVMVDGVGASGTRAMEVTYREGEQSAGWMVLSFGTSPLEHGDRPTHAPQTSFSDVYWRLRVMTEPGWPDVGPGQLTRTVSFAADDWTEAVVAHLRSSGEGVNLEAAPVTCVSGSEIACVGYDDQSSLEPLGPLPGEAPVYSESMSGQWVCVEGHMRLNTPGLADGVLEFWVDEERQAGRDDLDLRGSWTEYGINALVIENRWPGGAPESLRRWIDDVVISTEPIGCTDVLDDAAPG